MSAIERTLGAERNFAPWWTVDPKSAALWRRPAILLRSIWASLIHRSPERRYERRILRRMARGGLVDTLGIEIRDETHTRAMAEQWRALLVKLGLGPDHLCVEYGCGSLWCAEPVIRSQRPGRFIGLDVTDRFYNLGRQRLGSLLSEKQVGLATISRRSLEEVAALKPDLVYSHRVLHHVPADGLARFMRNITSLLNERTILVIENRRPLAPDGSIKSRRYSVDDLRPYLPKYWRCRQEPFGFVITYQAG
jgi:hypothetical protein